MSPCRIPTATYRLQFTPDWGFAMCRKRSSRLAQRGERRPRALWHLRRSVSPAQRRAPGVLAAAGCVNSLAQTLLKSTAPGVPDFYQGTELWDDSLVDPDNRRPVDFSTRQALLAGLHQRAAEGLVPLVQELLAQWWDGRIKLYMTYQALQCRRTHRALCRDGDYLPLASIGPRRDHVVAFARR